MLIWIWHTRVSFFVIVVLFRLVMVFELFEDNESGESRVQNWVKFAIRVVLDLLFLRLQHSTRIMQHLRLRFRFILLGLLLLFLLFLFFLFILFLLLLFSQILALFITSTAINLHCITSFSFLFTSVTSFDFYSCR